MKEKEDLDGIKKCPKCGEEIKLVAKKCKHCQADLRNWFVKHKIITVILVLMLLGIIGSYGESDDEKIIKSTNDNTKETIKKEPESASEIVPEAETIQIDQEAKVTTDIKVEVDAPANNTTVPAEYKSALNKATTYANTMQMSKLGVYDQLVSEYGEKFLAAAAQYAIDNMEADWNANALSKARTYQNTMNMSPASIHDQLISEYGEKFTQAEADYAIQHLND